MFESGPVAPTRGRHLHLADGCITARIRRCAISGEGRHQEASRLFSKETFRSSHTFFEAPRALNQKLTVLLSEVWTTGMLVAMEGLPDKRAGAPTLSKVILTTGNSELRTTLPN